MQNTDKPLFETSSFRIQKKGSRDQSRVKNFFAYSGPDDVTRWILATNGLSWIRDPLSFWKNPEHPIQSTANPGQLIEFYINAKCDGA
jgi:hypothetical protein